VVELDCDYLENWSFLDDIKIIFKTIYVVMKRKGAIWCGSRAWIF
jgi:lipopolysaccharide/colanic/teichoic acid biosynthesis glycosyltransferase